MPELPEVESLARYLSPLVHERTVESVQVTSIQALKTFEPPIEALRGLRAEGCERRGKFLALRIPPLWLVLHLARAGWVRWRDQLPAQSARLSRGPLALRVGFEGGSGLEATEQGTEKRLAAYVVRDLEAVPGIAQLGIDALDPSFDAQALRRLLAEHPAQLKGFLSDQRVLAGVGNAYSDEALNLARLSPFARTGSLTAEEADRLHGALVEVLRDAVERSAELPASGLKAEKRAGMRVHGRTGQPCPRCGDSIREVAYATRSFQYCAACQTGGRPLADRRMSRLLK